MTALRLDPATLDVAVEDLQAHAGGWVATGVSARIGLLDRLMAAVLVQAPGMTGAAASAKGYPPDSPWAVEDWVGGPWALAQAARAYTHVLRRLQHGKAPVPARAVHEQPGRTVVDVFPAAGGDRLLFNAYRAQAWMTPGITPERARADAARTYRAAGREPGVALVLGAGNVAAITALDTLHQLYVQDHVVVAKLNPVNAYLRPFLEAIFSEFIDHGWVHIVEGGAEVGGYLAGHHLVGSVHVTGSARTHDALVWGDDGHTALRRRAGTPLLTKPLSAELGGVSPCIVVPGRWSAADYRYQAEHIVSTKLNNAGHNCIATQILVLPDGWDGSDRLLTEIRGVLAAVPPRPDYYPGAADRVAGLAAAHPSAESYAHPSGGTGCGLLVPVPSGSAGAGAYEDPLLHEEVFATVLGVVRLPGAGEGSFLDRAVDFANDHLPGTLAAMVIIDPGTERSDHRALTRAVERLRYGTVGVNTWAGYSWLLGYPPWGAHPGHTPADVGSGTGHVHNAFMLEGVQKTVIRSPFAPVARGLLHHSPSMSPKPPYFVTNRTGTDTVRRMLGYTARPGVHRLPGIFTSALRG